MVNSHHSKNNLLITSILAKFLFQQKKLARAFIWIGNVGANIDAQMLLGCGRSGNSTSTNLETARAISSTSSVKPVASGGFSGIGRLNSAREWDREPEGPLSTQFSFRRASKARLLYSSGIGFH